MPMVLNIPGTISPLMPYYIVVKGYKGPLRGMGYRDLKTARHILKLFNDFMVRHEEPMSGEIQHKDRYGKVEVVE